MRMCVCVCVWCVRAAKRLIYRTYQRYNDPGVCQRSTTVYTTVSVSSLCRQLPLRLLTILTSTRQSPFHGGAMENARLHNDRPNKTAGNRAKSKPTCRPPLPPWQLFGRACRFFPGAPSLSVAVWRPTTTAVIDGACVAATDKSAVSVGRQTKKRCNAMFFTRVTYTWARYLLRQHGWLGGWVSVSHAGIVPKRLIIS